MGDETEDEVTELVVMVIEAVAEILGTEDALEVTAPASGGDTSLSHVASAVGCCSTVSVSGASSFLPTTSIGDF